MTNFKYTSLLLAFICFDANSQSTPYGEIEKHIEGNIGQAHLDNTKGWKYLHRWMDEFKRRVDENGDFYPASEIYHESERVAQLKVGNLEKMAGWVPVGPTQRADASSLTKGLGRVNCITFHPTDPNTFWVGVSQGGVWKTTNSGQNWTPLTDDLPILRISDIAVDPNNPDIIYISVGDYAYMDVALNLDDRNRHSHYGIGVYKTTDGGTTWNPTGLTYQMEELDGSLIRRVLIDPVNTNNLVAAGVPGILTSSDGGANWTPILDTMIWDIEIDPNNANIIYASSGYLRNSDQGTAGIMKSVDFGATWSYLNTGIPPTEEVLRIEIAIAPTNSDHIYALTCDSLRGFYGLYSSLDGGTTWSYSDGGGVNILHWYEGNDVGGQGTYDLSILVDPNDENIIYTGGINVWGSTDGGATFDGVSLWYDAYGPGLHADQHQFKFNVLDQKFYVCNDGGLVRTDDIQIGSWSDAQSLPNYEWPTNWEFVADGMQTNSFYRVAISEGNSGHFAAGAQDNSTYFNNGGNWSNLFGGDGMNCILHPSDPNTIIGSSQYGRILYSSNGGSFYNQMDGPWDEDGEWVTPFMYEPNNPDLVYAGFGNLYSASPGDDFIVSHSSFGPMSGAPVPSPVSHFNISESDPSTIYLAKRIYHSYNEPSKFWVTQDGGNTWIDRTNGLPDHLYFNFVEVDDTDPLSAWVVVAGYEASSHVYHTSDAGATWNNITYDLPNLPTNCIVHRDSSFYNTVYVGTDIGVYYSNDTMNYWLPYNEYLPNVIVADLEIHYNDQQLYAATFGRGVWKTDILIDSIANVSLPNIDMNSFEIDLYPNPNDGNFHLKIEEFKGDVIKMDLINIMGEILESRELSLEKGAYSEELKFEVPDGMYFIKLRYGKSSKAVRFVVK